MANGTEKEQTLTQQVLGLVDVLLAEAESIKQDMRVAGLNEALALAQNEALRRIQQQQDVLNIAVELAHERIANRTGGVNASH